MSRKAINCTPPKYFDRTLTFDTTQARDFALTSEQKQYLSEIAAWERESAKADFVFGEPRDRPLSPLRKPSYS